MHQNLPDIEEVHTVEKKYNMLETQETDRKSRMK